MAAQESPVGAYYPQEIRYVVDDASEGYLVWGINGWQATEKSYWTEATFVSNERLTTPLEYRDGRLGVVINVPLGATIDCTFWITKSQEGLFRDSWDPTSYHLEAASEGPIIVTGSLEPARESHRNIVDRGWAVLLACLLALGGGALVVRALGLETSPVAYQHRLLLAAVSLYGFHFLTRLGVLQVGVRDLRLWHLGVGSSDLLYVMVPTGAFLVSGAWLRTQRAQRRLWWTFCAWTTLSLVAALLNIRVVERLGHPFNYRWLYYSDFLGSTEARSALAASASWPMAWNVVALCLAMVATTRLMIMGIGSLGRVRYLAPAILATALTVALLTLALGRSERLSHIDPGKLTHPVSAFLSSIGGAGFRATLASVDVPEKYKSTPLVHPQPVGGPGRIENVVLIVLESAGAEYFDLYGGTHDVTPTLNELRTNSILFENIYVHAPSTNKSLVSLLCSMYPAISYRSLTEETPEFEQPSLSSELARHGYRTAFFTSSSLSFQNSKEFLAHRSFDRVEDFREIPCADRFRLQGGDEGFNAGIADACLASRLSAWLDEDPSRRFFSVLWTNQGHYPYFLSTQERDFGVANVYFNRYLNALRRYDEMIAAVIDDLDARDLLDATLVVVAGDHGEAFGQHGQSGHGNGIYEENLRVPLILISPRLFTGERRSDLGGMIDLAPTVLHLTGHPIPARWQGRSLFLPDRTQAAFFFAPWSSYLFGGREGDFKIILDETHGRVELYDLSRDPKELRNLADHDSERTESMRLKVAAWVQGQTAWWRQRER